MNQTPISALFDDTKEPLQAASFDWTTETVSKISLRKREATLIGRAIRRPVTTQSSFKGIIFDDSDTWDGAKRGGGELLLESIAFVACQFTEKCRFDRIRFIGVAFRNCVWAGSWFQDCYFENCSFTSGQDGGTPLNATFLSCKFSGEHNFSGTRVSPALLFECINVAGSFSISKSALVRKASGGINPFEIALLGNASKKLMPSALSASSTVPDRSADTATERFGVYESSDEKRPMSAALKVVSDAKSCCDGIDLGPLVGSTMSATQQNALDTVNNTITTFLTQPQTNVKDAVKRLRSASLMLYGSLSVFILFLGFNTYFVLEPLSGSHASHFAAGLKALKVDHLDFHKAMDDALHESRKRESEGLSKLVQEERREMMSVVQGQSDVVATEMVKRLPIATTLLRPMATPAASTSTPAVTVSVPGTSLPNLGTPSSATNRASVHAHDAGSTRYVVELLDKFSAMSQASATNNTVARIEIGILLFFLMILAARHYSNMVEQVSQATNTVLRFNSAKLALELAAKAGDKGVFAKTLVDFNRHYMPQFGTAAEGKGSGDSDVATLGEKVRELIFGRGK